MLTRAKARLANALRPTPDSSLRSASQLPEPIPMSLAPVEASSSSSSDEYFSPLASPAPDRRKRRGRPPSSLGSRGPLVSNRIPAAGGEVHRMKWTQTINENVMRAYFRATRGGTNLTAYRSRMLLLFQDLEPAVNVSAQRLSDQVRVIQRSRLLDDVILERLRSESVQSSSDTSASQLINTITNTRKPTSSNQGIEVDDRIIDADAQYNNEELKKSLEGVIREYMFMPHNIRPPLPRLPTNRKNIALVSALDSILNSYLDNSNNLSDTHSILYCTALTACRVAGINISHNDSVTRPKPNKPSWQQRIESRIADARVLIGKLICFRSGNTRPRVMRFVKRAFLGTTYRPEEYMAQITERIDYLKQKVCAWANRIRRYKKRYERYAVNRMFQRDQKLVYRDWERPLQATDVGPLPDAITTKNFWSSIWSAPVVHSEGAWICDVERACENITRMPSIKIAENDVTCAVRSLSNWKSPGPDGLHNFWLKWLRSSHARIATQFQEAIEKGTLPEFLTTGNTYLLHKTGSTTDPSNYRPITCLSSIYKLLTSILRSKITQHIEMNSVISTSQNGCRKGGRGTKELLLIDMTINQQVRRRRGDLATAWIDYKKAFDSVPHTWLMRVLELYKVDRTLCTFLETCMRQWKTVLSYPGCRQSRDGGVPLKIQRGIFQGDSLSPLWFCLALNPLSTLLENSGLGYRLQRGSRCLSHLLYMDDLKLFASNRSQLVELLRVTQTFSSSINMGFGVDKCAVMHVKRGVIVESEGISLSDSTRFRSLSVTETYKYLGISQALCIKEVSMKQLMRKRFFGRLKKVLNSLLSGGNKVRAFNSWVMPVLMYSFGILKWTQTELDALDRKVRTLLTASRMHHPRSSVMRLYIPRRCGGRGFLNIKSLHNREVCSLRQFLLLADVDVIRDVVRVDDGFTPLALAKENWRKPVVLNTTDRLEVWRSKELHGRFYRALHGPDVDTLTSVSWLRFGDLFGETEGFVFAIMDEVMMTNNYRKYILKDGTVDICRACHCPGESIRHIVSGCSRLANGEYLHRHNQVARIIHQQIALKYNLVERGVPYYRYMPDPVLENGHITLYWDRSIVTDRTVVANRPDIVIVDRLERRAVIVDVTIPHDENLVKAEKDKQLKYLDLAHEISDMWDVDSTIIVPIVISVNGLIAKSLDQHLERLSLGSWIKGLMQKAVLLGTARIVRKFLSLGP